MLTGYVSFYFGECGRWGTRVLSDHSLREGAGTGKELRWEQSNHVMDKTHDLQAASDSMSELIDRLGTGRALLRAPLSVTNVEQRVFEPGGATEDEVIVTHRFILIESGKIEYTVEGVVSRLVAGDQFFVPAWSRREWVARRGRGLCRLAWCEFSSEAVSLSPVLCRRRPAVAREESRALARMRRWFAAGGAESGLRLEGELKAMLARFWAEAGVAGRAGGRGGEPHPEVGRATAWLERHFAEPEALEAFYRTLELSPNHFRLLFRRQTGETVQAVLARLRMRRARYLVRETGWPMKRIAAESGFADPLYFSNHYKRFWGRAATADRAGGGVA